MKRDLSEPKRSERDCLDQVRVRTSDDICPIRFQTQESIGLRVACQSFYRKTQIYKIDFFSISICLINRKRGCGR
jgi:hypothetical protein